ncbi:MAG: TRAP transporter small permease [Burkholderiaceae bacterium]
MLTRFSMAVDRTLVIAAAIAFFVMLSITVVSVIGRYFFNAPIPDDIVFNELLMVFLVFLPFAYVQRKRQHVTVTLVSDWFSKHNQYYFEVFGNVLGFLIFCLISYATWQDFQSSWEVLAYN